MKNFFITMIGEIRKQYHNYSNTKITTISFFIWPIIISLTTYYTYKPFDISLLNQYKIYTENELLIFLITGFLGYYCFWSQVESALYMLQERTNGTLEMVFLTPGNRFAILYGRSLGSLVQNMWLYTIFSFFLIILNQTIHVRMLLSIPLGFILLCICATIWGGFMNSLFLLTRDANIWFTIFDSPMAFLSGSQMPVASFPSYLKILSTVFPLTYCLILIRALFNDEWGMITWSTILMLVSVLIIIVFITYFIIKISEYNNRKTGNLQLY